MLTAATAMYILWVCPQHAKHCEGPFYFSSSADCASAQGVISPYIVGFTLCGPISDTSTPPK